MSPDDERPPGAVSDSRRPGPPRDSVSSATDGRQRLSNTGATDDDVAATLSRLMEVERFEPSHEFQAHARISDNAIYEEADRDFRGWWATQADTLLDWSRRWDTVLDESRAPFYEWFVGGQLNACHNCLDRHVEAGLGDRVANSAPSPTPSCIATSS